ncbi:hatching enzyme 1.2 [Hyalella azteca]|uniref:Metalloendopeptidase n=1 Tax=Hyalella azteca TaxID=294128 RepID=A0A8B7PNY1_HYAAZ|nr:hatching enzyme 1.2 [Hyalella azteca]
MTFKMARGKAHQTLLALCLCYAVVETISAPMDVATRADGSVLVGDMLYSADQWQSLLAKNLDSIAKLWPKVNGVVKIPYKISDPNLNVTLLKLAFTSWEANSCLEFPEMTASDTEYLKITIQSGCFSDVGYTRGKVTTVSIFGDACDLQGVIHELGHSLGLQHEHSRSDRDDNIIVVMSNVIPGLENNFIKSNTVNFEVPYDYYSVMHYQDRAGGKDNKRVFLAKDARFQEIMGNAPGISFMNMKLVNTMYGCIDAIVGKISPNSALIPPGGEVISPGYPTKGPREGIQYTQVMRAPEGQRAVVKFEDFQILPRFNKTCSYSSLEIRSDVSVEEGAIFCGEEISNGTVFKSNKSELILHYKNYNYAMFGLENWSRGYKAVFTTEIISN